jgi:hypothetical protein
VPKSKKPARREAPAWDIYRLKGSPAAYIGRVTAKDQDEAVKAAIEQYAVPSRFQSRLFAVRTAA